MVGVLIGMKLVMMRRTITGPRASYVLSGTVIGLGAAAATIAVATLDARDPRTVLDLLAVVFAVWTVAWALAPAYGGRSVLRAEHLAVQPIPPRARSRAARCGLRCRDHMRADRWYEAFEEFVDFYNGSGTFARWPASRRDRFLDVQRARGDLWDVLFEAPLTAQTLRRIPLIDGAGHMMPLTHATHLTRALIGWIIRSR